LQAATIAIKVKTGDGGKMFGSVTTTEVAEAISAQAAMVIDKKKISLPTAIKTTGEFSAEVKLRGDIVAKVALVVETQ